MSIQLEGAIKGYIMEKTLRSQYPLPPQGDMLNLLNVDAQ
jgi:hypothetical protein